MKKFYSYLTVLAALSFGVVACAEGPEEGLTETPNTPVNPAGYELTINANVDNGSRAAFGNDLKTLAWESGDALGLFIHDGETHVANNVKMSLVSESSFKGTISVNPDKINGEVEVFGYYPFNSMADDRNYYHETAWTINHPSRQIQVDANHTNYDNYAFFSGSDSWSNVKTNGLQLTDRMACLRFKIKAEDDETAALFGNENLEEVDIFVVNDNHGKSLKALSEADGVVPMSGHFKLVHNPNPENGEHSCGFIPVENETRNYVEVDFMGASTRVGEDPIEIKISTDNETYVWAVVPPFTLADNQTLVAIFNTASKKVVYTYKYKNKDNDAYEKFEFVANKIYNFKNVKAIADKKEEGSEEIKPGNICSNDPVVHTNDYLLGQRDVNAGKNYPSNARLTMEVDLPISGEVNYKKNMTYYIRYGYCDYCSSNTSNANHDGLDVPWTDALEKQITWAHEIEGMKDINQEEYYAATEAKENGNYRVKYIKIIGNTYNDVDHTALPEDEDILSAIFEDGREPVFQAYAVYTNPETQAKTTFYGHVVHMDLNPPVVDIENVGAEYANGIASPVIIKNDNAQIELNIPSHYVTHGSAPAPLYYVSTITTLRIYYCDITEQTNDDGSLKTATLEEAVEAMRTANTKNVIQLPTLQQLPNPYDGFYYDIWAPASGFIRYRNSKGQDTELATTTTYDTNSAFRFVMQAYDKETWATVWIRSEWFRFKEAKEANKQQAAQ